MTRLESAACSLTGGAVCVFVLAVALNRLPWQATFAAVAVTVVAWGWRNRLIVGAAIGVIAWLCVTGFDVYRLGEIRITGIEDVVRAAALVSAGVLAASAHAIADAKRSHGRADPVWVDFHGTGLEWNEISGDVMDRLGNEVSDPRGTAEPERPSPINPAEEPSDG